MITYYNPLRDESNYIYSIDNTVFIYYLKTFNTKKIAEELIAIREKNKCNGFENLNRAACSKYSWYQNIVHIGAIHISFGKYECYDKANRNWIVLPKLRIEVNVNKHYTEPVFQDILSWIKTNCTSGYLQKYDLAIDIPYTIDRTQIINSRKEPGLYKGTVYRGQRNQHGFLKIYDKAKEQQLDYPLTRIEYTLDPRKPLSLEHIIVIRSLDEPSDCGNLNTLNKCIVNLCMIVKSFGIDYEPYISNLNYRRKKTLQPFLYGSSMELIYDEKIIAKLLDNINDLFDADNTSIICRDNVETTDDVFLEIDDDEELPFD